MSCECDGRGHPAVMICNSFVAQQQGSKAAAGHKLFRKKEESETRD